MNSVKVDWRLVVGRTHSRLDRFRIRSLLGFLALAICLSACGGPSFTYDVPLAFPAPVQRPDGVDAIPVNVGVYYGPDFRSYVHSDHTVGKSKLVIPVGMGSAGHFTQAFSSLFLHSREVDQRPPFPETYAASNMAAVIETRIEDFDYDWRPMSAGPFTANVTYRFIVYSMNGATIASWTVSASDTAKVGWSEHAMEHAAARTDAAMQKASKKFMEEFQNRPGIKAWLAKLESPESPSASLAKATTEPSSQDDPENKRDTLEDLVVRASIYEQFGFTTVPYGEGFDRSQILAVKLTVENHGPKPVLLRPSDVTLKTNQWTTLVPASASRVTARMHQASGVQGSAVVGTLVNPVFGALMTLSEGSAADDSMDGMIDHFRVAQFKDTTIRPNASASGFIYFEATGIAADLDRAELRVRAVDPSSHRNFDGTLSFGHGMTTASITGLGKIQPLESTAKTQEEPVGKKKPGGPDPAESQPMSEAQPLTVAILPPGRGHAATYSPYSCCWEEDVLERLHAIIDGHDALRLIDSPASSIHTSSKIYDDPTKYWNGAVIKEPVVSEIYSAVQESNANIALLFFWEYRYGSIDISLYVFDKNSQRSYRRKGARQSLDDVENLIRGLLRQVDTSVATRRENAGATALAATAAKPRSTQSQPVAATMTNVSALGRLPAAEMRELVSGNTLSGKNRRGTDFFVYHSLEGKASGQAKLIYYDVGTWEISDDGRYCRQWTRWASGATDCYEMYRIGEGRYRMKGINYHYEVLFRILYGDPKRLKERL